MHCGISNLACAELKYQNHFKSQTALFMRLELQNCTHLRRNKGWRMLWISLCIRCRSVANALDLDPSRGSASRRKCRSAFLHFLPRGKFSTLSPAECIVRLVKSFHCCTSALNAD